MVEGMTLAVVSEAERETQGPGKAKPGCSRPTPTSPTM